MGDHVTRGHVLDFVLYSCAFRVLARPTALPDWLDWELVIIVGIACAGVWTMVAEARAHQRDATERIEIWARVAQIETAIASQAPHTIAERVSEIEGAREGEVDTAALSARVSALEIAVDLGQRLAAVEARIDHKTITHTRAKDGKFARTGADTCETP
jgi:hypothetical protein